MNLLMSLQNLKLQNTNFETPFLLKRVSLYYKSCHLLQLDFISNITWSTPIARAVHLEIFYHWLIEHK